MTDYGQRAERVLAKINELAAISDDPTGITRTFGTDAFRRGSRLIENWMRDIGLQTRVDAIGNVRGRLVSPIAGAKTFVVASHMDTVVNAGRFDGPMGVIMGLDLLDTLIRSCKPLPFSLELIAFSDEEGVRFHTTYLGSKVVAGSFDPELLTRTDASGLSLGEVIQTLGASVDQLATDALAADGWLGYVEIHIEQGPVLYERNVPVAVVTAIAGQKRVEIQFSGLAGHAGTVPMNMRQDALCAAAEFVLAVERFARVNTRLVATVGTLTVAQAASNVIPGKVTCSLDVRSNDAASLERAYGILQEMAQDIGRERGVTVNWQLIQTSDPVHCDPTLTALLAQAIDDSGFDIISLVSGAGHDGVPISRVAPIAMLFVRCFKGISHNPLEQVEVNDIAATLRVADVFMDKLRVAENNAANRRTYI